MLVGVGTVGWLEAVRRSNWGLQASPAETTNEVANANILATAGHGCRRALARPHVTRPRCSYCAAAIPKTAVTYPTHTHVSKSWSMSTPKANPPRCTSQPRSSTHAHLHTPAITDHSQNTGIAEISGDPVASKAMRSIRMHSVPTDRVLFANSAKRSYNTAPHRCPISCLYTCMQAFRFVHWHPTVITTRRHAASLHPAPTRARPPDHAIRHVPFSC